jgi:D-alanyl-D-alanine carboxypeptidase
MDHTRFTNASGLQDAAELSTAADLAKLAIALRRDFPRYYSLFSRTSFRFRGRMVEGHNRVTRDFPGADGLKTGFVNASGFNLVTSARRNGQQLVGVVLGSPTWQERDARMKQMLNEAFAMLGASRAPVTRPQRHHTRPKPTHRGASAVRQPHVQAS